MKMTLQDCRQLTHGISPPDLSKTLPKHFALRGADTVENDLTVLDDFDWNIFQSGCLLIREGKNKLQLWEADDNKLTVRLTNAEHRFYWQLPPGALADTLEELISIRAFVEKYSCHLKIDHLTILNAEDKIVVRINLYTVIGRGNQTCCFIKTLPLRGYAKEYLQVCKGLSKLDSEELPDLSLRRLLLHSGLDVNPPEKKGLFHLEDTEPAEAAVSRMAAKMIQLARRQEQGIIDDVDTEFVHQYRVNIRKTRSLISLFKKSLSENHYQLYKPELKALGSLSNNLRDLDVFLLDHDLYRDMLPDNLWPGLTQIYKRIKQRRTIALKKVVDSLSGEAYLEQISHILLTLQQPPELTAKQSEVEIKTLASQKILAQYQRICTDGAAIAKDTPDQAVHDLRVECKKLRYLLELFVELFPAKQVKQLVKSLKFLQDNLGRFNDFSVQREFLLHLGQGKNISADQLASINGLMAVLFNKQAHERNLVVDNISRFIDQPISDQFKRLLNTDLEKGSKV